MCESTEKSTRDVKMSVKLLLNNEETTRFSIKTLTSQVDEIILSSDEKSLRNYLSKLKESNYKYRSASIELSTWYRKNASQARVAEVNEERRDLYEEYRLAYKSVNERIIDLGLPAGSSVSDVSEYREAPSRVSEWLNEPDKHPIGCIQNDISDVNQSTTFVNVSNVNEPPPPQIGAKDHIHVEPNSNLVPNLKSLSLETPLELNKYASLSTASNLNKITGLSENSCIVTKIVSPHESVNSLQNISNQPLFSSSV